MAIFIQKFPSIIFCSFLIFISLISLSGRLSAAEEEPAKNAIYAELLGQGLGVGIYYDRMLADNFAVRAGVSTIIVGYGYSAGASYLTSGNHKFEVGGGVSYMHIHDWFSIENGYYSSLNIGYRYQQDKPGFMFRAAYTPLFGVETVHLIGFSFGKSF